MTAPRFTFTDRAAPVLQIGVGDWRVPGTGAVWGVSKWDTAGALWAGVEPTWLDVSCEAFDAETTYGRRAVTDRYQVGIGSVTVRNLDGWADPHAVANPAQLDMRPGRALRFGIAHRTLGTRWLFRGIIDTIVPTYDPASNTPTVEFGCIDALGEVNRARLAPLASPAGAETVSARLNRILDRAGHPPSKRDIAASGWAVVADELAGQVADLLGQTAESAGGFVWGDTDGRIGFRHRDWLTFNPATPPDATIGNMGASDVCPGVWQRPFDRAAIATRVIVGRDPDNVVTVDDPNGQILYGVEPYERTDLLTASDPALGQLARQLLATRAADTAPRIRSVNLDARTADNALDLMTTCDVFKPSRYRCRLALPDRVVFDDVYLATGVAHRVTADAWTLELNLDLAEPWETLGSYWDSGQWDRARWSNFAASIRRELEGVST